MSKINLFVDFDDVIIKTSAKIDERLNEVYKCASYSFYAKRVSALCKAYNKRLEVFRKSLDLKPMEFDTLEINLETIYNRLQNETIENAKYRDINLDYVLEVLNNCEHYSNPNSQEQEFYLDYDQILDIRYVIDDAIELIRKLMQNENFVVEVLSHKNSERESLRKIDLIREYLGRIDIHLLDFHSDLFNTGRRIVNSKAQYVMDILDLAELDDSYILIDDSKRNIQEWLNHGGRGILFSRTWVDGFSYQMQEMTMNAFAECLNDDVKKLLNIECLDDDVKKLVKKR